MKTILVILVVLVLWSVWGFFSSRVEQAEYSVVKKGNGYEIRNYPVHIVAMTSIAGSYNESMNRGFGIVAEYIFGGNTRKESIAMTTPVVAQRSASEKIAMTSPVVVNRDGDSNFISFGMPKGYTLETLPTPNDSRVKLVEVPTKNVAVIRFSWYRNDNRLKIMESALLDMLSRDSVEVIGSSAYAGYNAPWTPPWMTRNEILVEVK